VTPESENNLQLEIGHVLFIDLVGYSKLLIEEQKERLRQLTDIVLATSQVAKSTNEQLVRLPAGDGMALVFRNSSEEPAKCALEIAQALKAHPEALVRMGIHSGPVSEVTDVSGRTNIAGPGINMAQRVMDCGDAGHILLSRRAAEDLEQYRQWQPRLHELGECEVKHGVRVSVVSLYTEEIGNPARPSKFSQPNEQKQVEATESPTAVGKQNRWGLIATVLLATAALVAVAVFFFRQSPTAPATATKSTEANSVAVLPFENLSQDKENEYFSDGISEELLTVLQKIPGLHVAARTSAFSFKDKNTTAQEIGQKLGVANLVEGSVRKSDKTVRIAARLSRAATGEQLWSESYTRDLKDVFAVQSEIAQTIVTQLRGKLGGAVAERVRATVRGGTTNPEAYEQFLQGRYYVNRFSIADFEKARTFLERACQLDPKFPLAWATLSQVWTLQTSWSDRLTRAQFAAGLAHARETAERALQLDPDFPEALTARFQIQFLYDYNWKGAAETIRRAQALAPSDPVILTSAAQVAVIFHDYAGAVDLARQAVALDPVNAQVRVYLANALMQARQPAESRAEYERVAELNPSTPWAFAGQGVAYLFEGKNAEALTATEHETSEFARLVVSSVALWNLHRKEESDAALATLIKDDGDVAAFQIAEVYSGRGDKDEAFAWLERARRQQDGGLSYFPHDPLLDPLRSDPRWVTFQRSMGWADDQLR
jgi:TolB-like protein/tetratricopeptide (TPR) repeat protein